MTAPSEGSASAAANLLKLAVPKHAMGMIIGKGGAGIRDFESIPELTSCRLEELHTGGLLTVTGSVRSLVVVAERIDDIINVSYERNVRRQHGHTGAAPPTARPWHGNRDRGRTPAYYRPRRLGSPQAKRRRSESPECAQGRVLPPSDGRGCDSDHD